MKIWIITTKRIISKWGKIIMADRGKKKIISEKDIEKTEQETMNLLPNFRDFVFATS
jgi:hypothetical protein